MADYNLEGIVAGLLIAHVTGGPDGMSVHQVFASLTTLLPKPLVQKKLVEKNRPPKKYPFGLDVHYTFCKVLISVIQKNGSNELIEELSRFEIEYGEDDSTFVVTTRPSSNQVLESVVVSSICGGRIDIVTFLKERNLLSNDLIRRVIQRVIDNPVNLAQYLQFSPETPKWREAVNVTLSLELARRLEIVDLNISNHVGPADHLMNCTIDQLKTLEIKKKTDFEHLFGVRTIHWTSMLNDHIRVSSELVEDGIEEFRKAHPNMDENHRHFVSHLFILLQKVNLRANRAELYEIATGMAVDCAVTGNLVQLKKLCGEHRVLNLTTGKDVRVRDLLLESLKNNKFEVAKWIESELKDVPKKLRRIIRDIKDDGLSEEAAEFLSAARKRVS